MALAHAFQVRGDTWVFNAVDGQFHPIRNLNQPLPDPTAKVSFGCGEELLQNRIAEGPAVLTLALTGRGSLGRRCCMRPADAAASGPQGDPRMTEATACRGVEQFLARNTARKRGVTIVFAGDEPLDAIDVMQAVIAHVASRYPDRICRFAFTTHGEALTPDLAESLLRQNCCITVRLDGPRDVHDVNLTADPRHASWNAVMRNLHALYARDPERYRKQIGFAAVNADPRLISELHRFFCDEPLVRENALRVYSPDAMEDGETHWAALTPSEQKAYDEYLDNLADRLARDVLVRPSQLDHFAESLFIENVRRIHERGETPLEASPWPRNPCVPGIGEICLTARGEYRPCERVTGAFPLGDVDRGFDQQAAVSLLHEYLAVSKPECSRCWAVRFCSPCIAEMQTDNSLSVDRLRSSCAAARRDFERAFRSYVTVVKYDRAAWRQFFDAASRGPLAWFAD
jgi:uncharacterized protein